MVSVAGWSDIAVDVRPPFNIGLSVWRWCGSGGIYGTSIIMHELGSRARWAQGKDRARAGQGRAGQGRAGQGRAGQGRAGQGRPDQTRPCLSPSPYLSLCPTRCRARAIFEVPYIPYFAIRTLIW